MKGEQAANAHQQAHRVPVRERPRETVGGEMRLDREQQARDECWELAEAGARPASFTAIIGDLPLAIELNIAGRHNVRNALAAAGCAHAIACHGRELQLFSCRDLFELVALPSAHVHTSTITLIASRSSIACSHRATRRGSPSKTPNSVVKRFARDGGL